MVVRDVPLGRLKELLFGVACNLRPAFAVRRPSVPVRDLSHMTLVYAASWRFVSRPAEGGRRCDPGVHGWEH